MVKIISYPVSGYSRLSSGYADPYTIGYKLMKRGHDVLFLHGYIKHKLTIAPKEVDQIVSKGCIRLISNHQSSHLPYFENVISIDSHSDLEYNLPTSKRPWLNYASWLSHFILKHNINAAILGCQQSCSGAEIVFWTEQIDNFEKVAFLPYKRIKFSGEEVYFRLKQIEERTEATGKLSSKWEKKSVYMNF